VAETTVFGPSKQKGNKRRIIGVAKSWQNRAHSGIQETEKFKFPDYALLEHPEFDIVAQTFLP